MNGLYSLSLPMQALLATVFTWSVTALGAALVIFTRRVRPTLMDALLGFGAGVMLASSFWSLLAPSIDMALELGQLPWLVGCCGFLCGGCILMLGDALLARHLPAATMTDSRRRCWMLVTSITLHNIPEGLAIGVAFGALSFGMSDTGLMGAWMLALGIGLQNFPEGAAVSLPLRREGLGRGKAFFFGQLSALVEPFAGLLGALLAMMVHQSLPFMLSFAAGAMISVVVAELVPESQRNPHKNLMTFAMLAGFSVMMLLDVALG
ncbi:MAG: ZIP family metal transporter [Clostridiales bacterium]|nr:ZIP family metal transporter [Clostridiales bacterium]